ncbi:MAG: hypothetical protein NZL94_06195 [Meiothermus sp.]|uniref:hypothetical protein n=1 Tax=Meiothermus sp. TaxID=1955249 RepID=UPI00262D39FB|nr:hypothetical protein [Meiothermus sp.]MCS7058456.1 hypothetical protein [Meiothermus sp.]MCX7740328.1 hypothetical protein [Meiothermus sp.]MDW8482062.1 hypothetical protein [Meiothermus sp.]
MVAPRHAAFRPLVVLYRGKSQWYPPLLTVALQFDLPLFVYAQEPQGPFEAALEGLFPLGLGGAVLEDPALQAQAAAYLPHLEPEAAQARQVDLVVPEPGGSRGFYQGAIALARLIGRYALGDKALWVGPLRPELIPGLRGLSVVSVVSPSFPEGEAFLRQLPSPQRGVVAVSEAQAQAVARQADLLIYAGGPLALGLLQPYHRVLALRPLASEALLRVGECLSPELWQRFWLSALLEPLGYDLPPEVFAL